jgi:putative NADH-flavin reductase
MLRFIMPKFVTALLRLVLMASLLMVAVADATTPFKITVYGGSGKIGSRIVKEALSRGHTVTVVVRKPDEVKLDDAHLSVVKGDVTDSAGVAKQVAGQDAVVSAVSQFDSANFIQAVAKSLVNASRQLGKGAPRFIAVGGAGSLEVAPGKLLIDTMSSVPPGIKDQKLALDYFRTVKDVDWTVVTPSKTIEAGQRTGKFRIGGDQLLVDEKGDSRISMEDFAVAIVDEIEHPQHLKARFTVGY